MANFHIVPGGAGAHDGSDFDNAYSFSEFITAYALATGGGDNWYFKGTFALSSLQTIACACPANNPHLLLGSGTLAGDWDLGYAANGLNVTTNFAVINFTNTSGRLVLSATNTLAYGFNITGQATSNAVVNITGQGSMFARSRITNTSTGSQAAATNLGHITAKFTDCDIFQTGASGANPAATWNTAATYVKCRAKSTNGSAFFSNYSFGQVVAVGCLAYESVHGFEINTSASGAHMLLLDCTAYGNSGNNVEINAAVVGVVSILYTHDTDAGGYGVDANGATCSLILHRNRYRDNATAALNVAARQAAAEYGAVTTDTGGVATDFNNAAGGDFGLIYGAPGVDTSARRASIGAGDPVQTAPGAGSGGGARRFIPIPVPMR